MRILLLSVLILLGLDNVAQYREIDELKSRIKHSGSLDNRINAIFQLCEQGYSLHPDTLMFYAQMAHGIAEKDRNTMHMATALFHESSALTNKGLIDSSLLVAERCLAMVQGNSGPELHLKANILNQKGRCYMRKNQYKQAIDMGYQVIVGAEAIRDTLLQIKGKTLIGWAYLEMGQATEALKWHLLARETTTDTMILHKYGILFANLALNYSGLGKTDSALLHIRRAIAYSREGENLFALSNSLAIQAQLFVRAGQKEKAEEPLREVVEIRKQIGDPFYIVSDMSQLALYYANNGQPEKGIQLCKEGIAIATQFKLDTKLFFLYGTLAENYKVKGDMTGYSETLEKIITLKDSVYQVNSAESLAEMQTKYDLQRKENLIMRQRFDITQKNYLLYGSIIVLLLAFAAAYLLFNSYRKRQKLKVQLMLTEEKQMSVQAVTYAEEKERKRIAADLHDNLGAYAASIASNLEHIHLKDADVQSQQAMQELRTNSQAIVSQLSDSIWALKKDALSLTAISDRIKVFIQRVRSSYPRVNMEVKEEIQNDELLPPSQAFHLFQSVQEAIINALKHSGCRQINVTVVGAEHWAIRIQDDGKGMGIREQHTGGGNGIVNMNNRAREGGWTIEWIPVENGGTTVVIEPTTN